MKKSIGKRVISGSVILSSVLSMGVCSIPMVNAQERPTLEYSSHIQDYGWLNTITTGVTGKPGKAKRLEAFKLAIKNVKDVSLKFDVHIQDYGWRRNLTEKSVLGTTGQSKRLEAIVVKANGLADKGYKLQYKVYVQGSGWTDWIDEGNVAGTVGESKRIEAIEFRIDDLKTPINVIVEEYKNQIEAYTLALVSKYETDDEFGDSELNAIYEKIDEALVNLDKAEDEENAAEIYDSIVREIKVVTSLSKPGELDEAIKDITEKAEAKKEELKNQIEVYKEVLLNSNLSKGVKTNIELAISKAEESINIAKTEGQAQKAYNNMATILNSYKGYSTEVYKQEIINSLNELSVDKDPVLQAKIAEAISAIEEIDSNAIGSKDQITDIATEIETDISDVINGKKDNLDILNNYLDLVDYASLSSGIRAALVDKINDSIEIIENATSIDEINEAMDAVNSVINNGSYTSFIAVQTLKDTINTRIEEDLNKYLGIGEGNEKYLTPEYSSIRRKAETYVKYYEECLSLDSDAAIVAMNGIKTIINSTVEPGAEDNDKVTIGTNEYSIDRLAKLSSDIDEAIADANDKAAQYQEYYDSTMALLNEYEEYMKIGNLSEEEQEDLSSLIMNTRVIVKESTTYDEIDEANKLFDEYVRTYFSDLKAKADEFKFESTKEDALELLKGYKDSKVKVDSNKVSDVANTAIENIEDEETDTVDEVNSIKNAAINCINNLIAQSEAIKTLETYNEYENISISYNEEDGLDVAALIGKIKEIDYRSSETTVEGINEILDEMVEKLEVAVEDLKIEVEYKKALNDANKYITQYLKNDAIKNIAKEYLLKLNSIENENKTAATVNEIKEEFYSKSQEEIERIENEKAEAERLAIETAKNGAIDCIDEYISMANDLGNDKLIEKLQEKRKEAEEAETKEEADNIKSFVTEYMGAAYGDLAKKSAAIEKIKTSKELVADADQNDDNVIVSLTTDKIADEVLMNYTQYASIVNDAINAIKELENDENLDTEITSILNTLKTDCSNEKTKIKHYIEYAASIKEQIANLENIDQVSYIVDYYSDIIDQISYDEYCEYGDSNSADTSIFAQYIEKATADIEFILAEDE